MDDPADRISSPPGAGSSKADRDVRVLGRAFDVLVRSVRTHGSASELAAQRMHELWGAAQWPTIIVKPTELAVNGVTVLGDGGYESRWLLAAFMAGLRGFRPKPGLSVDDLRRFAEALSRLDTDVTVVQEFRDWLWSSGAQGLDVDLQTSFMEVIESAAPTQAVGADDAVTEALSAGLSAVRAEAASSLSVDARAVASTDLDVVALREEFDAPIDLAAPRAFDPRLAPDEALRAEMRDVCEDPAGWRVEEVAAVLSARTLQAAFSPERLARMLTEALLARFDTDLVGHVTTLARRNDPYAREALAALDDPNLAEVIVLVLSATGQGARLLADVLVVASKPFAGRIAHKLLDAASADREVLASVSRVTATVGLARFCKFVEPAALTASEAQGLARLVSSSRGGTHAVAAMLGEMPARHGLAVIIGFEPRQLAELEDVIAALLTAVPPSALSAHVPQILERHGASGARALGRAFARSSGRGWSLEAVRALAAALPGDGLAGEFLLPVVRARGADVGVRVGLMDALADDPGMYAEVTRWRAGELLDPPEFRDRLRALRERGAPRR